MAYDHMDQLTNSLSRILSSLPTTLQSELGQGAHLPKRYFIQRPEDTGAFVLPIKQSFVKDARLMPGTRCMLALLVGWAGKGRELNLTQGTIAKHIGRSIRQVYRYLKEAVREGYLTYNYTKNRMGMIKGLKVFLNFDLMRFTFKKRRIQARTHVSDTNTLLKDSYIKDDKLEARLDSFRQKIEISDG